MSIRAADWDPLRRRLRGDVLLPGEAGYDAARQLQDIQFDAVRPSAVVYAENYPRLVRVKQHYDPHGFFHFEQSIGRRVHRTEDAPAAASGG
jgi:hypothetical protein